MDDQISSANTPTKNILTPPVDTRGSNTPLNGKDSSVSWVEQKCAAIDPSANEVMEVLSKPTLTYIRTCRQRY